MVRKKDWSLGITGISKNQLIKKNMETRSIQIPSMSFTLCQGLLQRIADFQRVKAALTKETSMMN